MRLALVEIPCQYEPSTLQRQNLAERDLQTVMKGNRSLLNAKRSPQV